MGMLFSLPLYLPLIIGTVGTLAHILSTTESPSTVPKTIVFSQTKDDVYTVFRFLHGASTHKSSVTMYHASQSQETKAFNQSNFRSSLTELRCISATIAFGMVYAQHVLHLSLTYVMLSL